MAKVHNVTAADEVFVGEDKNLFFTIFEKDGITPRNVTGWTFEWILRAKAKSNPPLLKKIMADGITLVGAFNIDPLVNTQKVLVPLLDSDTASEDGSTIIIPPKVYYHALKRVDDGSNTVLSHGSFELLVSSTW